MTHGQASIQEVLGGLLKNRHMIAGVRRGMIMSMWGQVVGELLAQKSWPERIAGGVLTVGVTSHSWAEELGLLKPQILSRYRQLLGRSSLKDVQFRVGRRRRSIATTEEDLLPQQRLHPSPTDVLPATSVPGHVLAGVQNEEVRELLGPVFARLRAQREWKREHGWARCMDCRRIFHGVGNCPYCGGSPQDA